MKLHCPGCQAVLSLADEKIPVGKEIKILCPRCRTPIEKAISGTGEENVVPDGASFTPIAETELETCEDRFCALDLLDEDTPLALLYIPQATLATRVEGLLREAGFHVTAVSKVRQGVAMLNQYGYRIVVTGEGSRPVDDADDGLLAAIGTLPMHARRQFLVCLVSETVPTLDRLTAFAKGVDLVINIAELDNAKILLTRALQERSALYSVYNEELARTGSF